MQTESTPGKKKVGECLYRNHLGTYFALVKVNGKQIKRSLKTDDAALAKRRLAEFKAKAEGLASTDRGLAFEGLTARWLAMKQPDLRPHSYRRLESIVRTTTPSFKGLPVRSIGQTEIEAWKIKRAAKLSARSFNYERDALRQLFEYARKNLRIILENPADTVKKRKQDKPQIVIPSKAQFCALLAQMRQEPKAQDAAYLIEFLGYSGLRLGEAIQVQWQDVNFDLGTLLVTGGENGTKNHEARSIPLFSPLLRFLLDLQEKQVRETCPQSGAGRPVAAARAREADKARALAPSQSGGDCGQVGRASEGRIFGLDSAKKAIITACRKAGLPHYGHHTMRHFFCSNAIEAGIDFKVIAGWLGHKDGGVLVARTYGHLRNEHSAAMAKRLTFDAGSIAA